MGPIRKSFEHPTSAKIDKYVCHLPTIDRVPIADELLLTAPVPGRTTECIMIQTRLEMTRVHNSVLRRILRSDRTQTPLIICASAMVHG